MNPGKLPQPYVQSNGELAHVNAARLVDPHNRKLADKPRKVEDPVVVKQKLKKVRYSGAFFCAFNSL